MKSSDYHYVARQGYIPIRNVLIAFVIICFSLTFPGMALIPAVVATELSGNEEVLPIYEKEDLQNTLTNIRGKLDAGFPVTTEISFLEDIRNELKRQLAEVEMKIEEDLATMPDVPGEEFNTDFDSMLDTANRLIFMIDDIIINPSTEGIDAVLELIETLDQEVQEDILAARMDLPDVAGNNVAHVADSPTITCIETVPTDADLVETDEIVFTDRVIAKAAELHNNFVHMVSWVTLNIKNEFYPGSMKTADKVLVDGAGSTLDICTLLTTFFRLNGVPAKYIHGKKELTVTQLMNWTGTSDIDAALEVIEGNNNPTVERFYNGTELVKVKVDHTYVAFYCPNNKWTIVDPASKEYINIAGSGFEIDQATIESLAETATVNEEETIVSVDYAAINDILADQSAVYDKDEVLGKREILATQKIIPPLYLVRGVLPTENYIEEFSAIPSHLQAKFKVKMTKRFCLLWWCWEVEILTHETTMAEIAGKRVSVYYEPTDSDAYNAAIEEWGSIYNVPNSRKRFSMKPVLQIGGEVTVTGTGAIMLGDHHRSYTYFQMPGSSSSTQSKWLRAGNKYDLSIPTQETSVEEWKRIAEELRAVLAESDLGENDIATDDMILERLRLAGMFYFAAKGALSEQIARKLNIITTNHLSLGYICDEIAWNGHGVKKAGVHIDVVKNTGKAISATGSEEDVEKYRAASGWISTGMESTMIELIFDSSAASTAKVFTEATKQGVPLHKIRPGYLYEDLAKVTIVNSATYNHIVNHVYAGYTAVIPQRPITIPGKDGTAWRGEGWLVRNPNTGAAGYMICGGIVYGGQVEDVVLINGGSSTTIIDHPLSAIETALWLLIPAMGALSCGLGHIVWALDLFAACPALGPFCLAGIGLGAIFAVAALAIFVTIFSNYPLVYFMRQRRYAYV